MNRKYLLTGLLALALLGGASAAEAQNATVYVIHGISGGSLGLANFGFPVDIAVNGGCAITGLAFTGITGPLSLPAGSYQIDIYAATSGSSTCKGSPALSATVELKKNRNYSIVAHLDESGAPSAAVFRNESAEARAAGGSVTVRHAAAAPLVDALVKKGNSVTPVGPFGNGEELGPVELKGNFELGLGLPGTGEPVFGYFNQKFQRGINYFVYAFGSVSNGTLAFVVHSIR